MGEVRKPLLKPHSTDVYSAQGPAGTYTLSTPDYDFFVRAEAVRVDAQRRDGQPRRGNASLQKGALRESRKDVDPVRERILPLLAGDHPRARPVLPCTGARFFLRKELALRANVGGAALEESVPSDPPQTSGAQSFLRDAAVQVDHVVR